MYSDLFNEITKVLQNKNIQPIEISSGSESVYFKDANTNEEFVFIFSELPLPEAEYYNFDEVFGPEIGPIMKEKSLQAS